MEYEAHEIIQKLYDDDAGKHTELKNFLEEMAKSNYIHFYKLESEAVDIVNAFVIKRGDYLKPWAISPAGNLDKKNIESRLIALTLDIIEIVFDKPKYGKSKKDITKYMEIPLDFEYLKSKVTMILKARYSFYKSGCESLITYVDEIWHADEWRPGATAVMNKYIEETTQLVYKHRISTVSYMMGESFYEVAYKIYRDEEIKNIYIAVVFEIFKQKINKSWKEVTIEEVDEAIKVVDGVLATNYKEEDSLDGLVEELQKNYQ